MVHVIENAKYANFILKSKKMLLFTCGKKSLMHGYDFREALYQKM